MYIVPDPASRRSQALYMTNIQENKLHLIKSRFKQMFKSTNRFTISDRFSQSIPQSRGSNNKSMIPKAFELQHTTWWLDFITLPWSRCLCFTFVLLMYSGAQKSRTSVSRFGRSGNLNRMGSNPGRVKPMTLKLKLVASLPGTRHY